MHITHCQYNESVYQKEEPASLINTILIKISTLLTLESLKRETFASDMFSKLGSLLSVTCRHCSEQARAVDNARSEGLGSWKGLSFCCFSS